MFEPVGRECCKQSSNQRTSRRKEGVEKRNIIRVIGIPTFRDDENVVRICCIVPSGGCSGVVETESKIGGRINDSLLSRCSYKWIPTRSSDQIMISFEKILSRFYHLVHPIRRELVRTQRIIVFPQKRIVAFEGTHSLLYFVNRLPIFS